MTKEEYKTTYAELRKREKEIEAQLDNLKNDYLESNATEKPGDKVRVIWREWGSPKEAIAYVTSYWVSGDGVIRHSFIKAKKDGSPSSQKLHTYGSEYTIELLEPDKP